MPLGKRRTADHLAVFLVISALILGCAALQFDCG
jgi:hypothetical protein